MSETEEQNLMKKEEKLREMKKLCKEINEKVNRDSAHRIDSVAVATAIATKTKSENKTQTIVSGYLMLFFFSLSLSSNPTLCDKPSFPAVGSSSQISSPNQSHLFYMNNHCNMCNNKHLQKFKFTNFYII